MPKKSSSSKKRNLVRFVGMVIGIGIVGIIVGIAGALTGAFIMKGQLFGFGDLAGALMGLIVGYPIGVMVGIILINKVLHYRGSLLFGVIGSILGAFLTMGLAEPLNLNLNPNILFGVFFLSVPLLCTIGFRLKS